MEFGFGFMCGFWLIPLLRMIYELSSYYNLPWKIELAKEKYEEYVKMVNFMEEHKWVM